MNIEIIHYSDFTAENQYHLLCKRYWVTPKNGNHNIRKEGCRECADGHWMVVDEKYKDKVTCPLCRAKLN